MILDFSPLVKNRNFRLLYFGQVISNVGSMVTYVALPYQIFQITHSSFAVGMMGVVELVPLLFTALIGGVYADTLDRRKLLLISEFFLSIGCFILLINAFLPHPSLAVIYVAAALMSAVNGFHRPALESLTPRLVLESEIPAVSSLSSLKGLIGTVGGPALGGILISTVGVGMTFFIDLVTFALSMLVLTQLRIPIIVEKPKVSPLAGIREGLQYAWGRPELLGSYVIDFVAMIFGMPMALFPAISETLGGAGTIGLFYAAPSVGALVATLFSGWTRSVDRVGVGIAGAATVWGFGILAFGMSPHLGMALFFLVLAGSADAISGVFRLTLWNQTIPDHLRGRLAGLEMLSYMSGPLLGNAESGIVAAGFGTHVSVISGGLFCILAVIVSIVALPLFWKYRLPARSETGALSQ